MPKKKKYKDPKLVQFLMERSEWELAVEFGNDNNLTMTDLLSANLFINLKERLHTREVEDALKKIVERKAKNNDL